MGWVCFQLGAREHFAIPSYLHSQGILEALVTDVWIPDRVSRSGIVRKIFPKNLLDRSEHDLSSATVASFTAQMVLFEGKNRVFDHRKNWNLTIARNSLFQKAAIGKALSNGYLHKSGGKSPVVFAYSYAALEILRLARSMGCHTVLGQIDPGKWEENLVANLLASRNSSDNSGFVRAPDSYWSSWRKELELADTIIVNSEWSRKGLISEGAAPDKIITIPLCYRRKPPSNAKKFPASFDARRPLRILFLGSLSPRKGVPELIDAAKMLEKHPVDFTLVGPSNLDLTALEGRENIKWFGPRARTEAMTFFDSADVFVIPTHSDGFAITQLEAQAAGLPIIASKNCGTVVEHGENGILLPEVSAQSIYDAVTWGLRHPSRLEAMSKQASSRSRSFHPDHVLAPLKDLT